MGTRPVLRRPTGRSLYRVAGKRGLDLSVSVVALVLTLPLQAAAYALVRRDLGPPVLFRQERAGRHGRVFTIYKFRTMTTARDAGGALLPDDQRLTRAGRFLRVTSLDELPQLWNVARGDMSLVGPRPLHARYLPRYSPEQARRHEVRPGITGWAVVSGRNALGWEEKLAADVWYCDHLTLGLDLRVLLRTLVTVVAHEGVDAGDGAPVAEFLGSQGADLRSGLAQGSG